MRWKGSSNMLKGFGILTVILMSVYVTTSSLHAFQLGGVLETTSGDINNTLNPVQMGVYAQTPSIEMLFNSRLRVEGTMHSSREFGSFAEQCF